MTLAYVFPGQGAQKIGLGKSLIHLPSYKETFEKASDLLGEDLYQICQSEKIHDTRYTQVALFTASLATVKLLPKEVTPACVLGLSLGEYTGVVCSQGISFEDFFSIVKMRGEKMAAIAKKRPGKMLAVLNSEEELIQKACEKASQKGIVAPCNFNTAKQTVIGGEVAALEIAKEYLLAHGVKKIIPLEVSGAFHTPLFQEVAKEMKSKLQTFTFNEKVPLLSNATGRIHEKEKLVENLANQISHPVQMVKMSETLNALGITEIVELGCGKVVGSLIKKNQKQIATHFIEDEESLEKFLMTWEGKRDD